MNFTVQELTFGARATFLCDPGYSLVGNVSITCEQEGVVGMWSNDVPTCVGKKLSIKVCSYDSFVFFSVTAIECSMVNALPNGTVMYSVDTVAPFEFDTVATLSCDNGFFLVGDDVRVCEDDDQLDTVGVWSESNATCEGKLPMNRTLLVAFLHHLTHYYVMQESCVPYWRTREMVR